MGIANELAQANQELRAENERLKKIIWTPETEDFLKGVELEVAHQQDRWHGEHDEQKTDADWFWVLGYLGQKAMVAAQTGDIDKAKHHCVSSAALMGNWHRILSGRNTLSAGDSSQKER